MIQYQKNKIYKQILLIKAEVIPRLLLVYYYRIKLNLQLYYK